ncbi:DMT family transporter [Deefgea sp. CFH1-16]|uniref:DMT family transporter n=1 Tax=Deefgea sp. CFH1-16 TaxID=2675457 RepID=UPI0015F60E46|nr:DMT family transporter [Deefgea sp. CFH1-16]MBM5573571.1 EamA-like transporter family protein [Deefgea sp. CFH1-16]
MTYLYSLFALTIGLIIPLQAAINNQLKSVIGHSTLLAALVSFSVGTLALLCISLATGQKISALAQLPKAEPWMLLGGLLGAVFVFGTTLIAPKLGAATMLSLIITGQIIASMLFDRFGWFAMPMKDLSWPRLLGAALIIIGVVLVNFGNDWLHPKP